MRNFLLDSIASQKKDYSIYEDSSLHDISMSKNPESPRERIFLPDKGHFSFFQGQVSENQKCFHQNGLSLNERPFSEIWDPTNSQSRESIQQRTCPSLSSLAVSSPFSVSLSLSEQHNPIHKMPSASLPSPSLPSPSLPSPSLPSSSRPSSSLSSPFLPSPSLPSPSLPSSSRPSSSLPSSSLPSPSRPSPSLPSPSFPSSLPSRSLSSDRRVAHHRKAAVFPVRSLPSLSLSEAQSVSFLFSERHSTNGNVSLSENGNSSFLETPISKSQESPRSFFLLPENRSSTSPEESSPNSRESPGHRMPSSLPPSTLSTSSLPTFSLPPPSFPPPCLPLSSISPARPSSLSPLSPSRLSLSTPSLPPPFPSPSSLPPSSHHSPSLPPPFPSPSSLPPSSHHSPSLPPPFPSPSSLPPSSHHSPSLPPPFPSPSSLPPSSHHSPSLPPPFPSPSSLPPSSHPSPSPPPPFPSPSSLPPSSHPSPSLPPSFPSPHSAPHTSLLPNAYSPYLHNVSLPPPASHPLPPSGKHSSYTMTPHSQKGELSSISHKPTFQFRESPPKPNLLQTENDSLSKNSTSQNVQNTERIPSPEDKEVLPSEKINADNQKFSRGTGMPPPDEGEFPSSETLISNAKEFAFCHGYGLSILRSNLKQVVLKCDRGGRHNNPPGLTNEMRQRSTSSRLIGCPFRLIGRQRKGKWYLTTIDSRHNHERSEDMSRHPICRKLDPETRAMLRNLAKSGMKPREILASLRLNLNSRLLVRQDVYNALSAIRREERATKSNTMSSVTMEEAIKAPIVTEIPMKMTVEENGSEEKGSEGKGSEGNGFEGKGSEGKGSEEKGSNEKGSEGKGSEGKRFEDTGFEEKGFEVTRFEAERIEDKGGEEKGGEREKVMLENPNVLNTMMVSMKEALSRDMSKGKEMFEAFFIIQKEVADVERARLEFVMKKEKMLLLERKEVRDMEEKARGDTLEKLRLEIELEKLRACRR